MTMLSVFPDVELMLMYVLLPLNPGMRIGTSLPAGDPTQITVRIKRSSGGNRTIGLDKPVVDIDVFGPKTQTQSVSIAARTIQAQLLSQMSAIVLDGGGNQIGVIQHVTTTSGPKQLPEVNQNFVRYNATYEINVHS